MSALNRWLRHVVRPKWVGGHRRFATDAVTAVLAGVATLAVVVSVPRVHGSAAAAQPPAASAESRSVVVATDPNPYGPGKVDEQRALIGPFVGLLRQIYLCLPEETQQKVEAAPNGFVVEVKWEDLAAEQRQDWVNIAVSYNQWADISGMWWWEFDGISGGTVRFWYWYREPEGSASRSAVRLKAAYEMHVWNSRRGRPAGELRHAGFGFPLFPGTFVAPQADNPYLGRTNQELTQASLDLIRDIYWSIPESKRREFQARAPNAEVTVTWEEFTPEQRQRWVNLKAAVFDLQRRGPLGRALVEDFRGAVGGSIIFGWYVVPGTSQVLMSYSPWTEVPDPVTGLPRGGFGGTCLEFEPGPYS